MNEERKLEIESRIRREVSKVIMAYPELRKFDAYTIHIYILAKDAEPTPDNLACVISAEQNRSKYGK